MNNLNIAKAIQAGLNLLSDKEIRVPSSDLEDLAELKYILKAIARGELVIASRDRLISEDTQIPDNSED